MRTPSNVLRSIDLSSGIRGGNMFCTAFVVIRKKTNTKEDNDFGQMW